MDANINQRHMYLIMIHKNIEQARKLLALLQHPLNDFIIHIDKKSSICLKDLEMDNNSNVKIFKEISVYWADYSQVQVELFLLEKTVQQAKERNVRYQYIHLLSGMDLPLKSQRYIHNFFNENNGKEFVEYQIPGNFIDKEYYSRTKYYHILSKYYRLNGNTGKIISLFAISLEYFCLFWQKLLKVNRIPQNMEYARGSNWFSITQELAEYILNNKNWIRKHYSMTRSGDESFLPMLVHNSKFKENLYLHTFDGDMHANMRYIDWTKGDPYVFRSKDFELLKQSDLLFARKFDQNIDNEIISKIYEMIIRDSN